MALSEDEQRLLDQMEAALAAEDPKLANALRGTNARRLHRRRAAVAGLVFLVGLAALIGGMELNAAVSVAVSVGGFLIMLAATVVAVNSWQHVGYDTEGQQQHPSGKGKPPERDFMDRIEERWRRRQDDGL